MAEWNKHLAWEEVIPGPLLIS